MLGFAAGGGQGESIGSIKGQGPLYAHRRDHEGSDSQGHSPGGLLDARGDTATCTGAVGGASWIPSFLG